MRRIMKIRKETYEKLRALAELEGRSVDSLTNELLDLWLDTNFEAIIGSGDGYSDDEDEEEEDEDWEDEDWEDEDEEEEE